MRKFSKELQPGNIYEPKDHKSSPRDRLTGGCSAAYPIVKFKRPRDRRGMTLVITVALLVPLGCLAALFLDVGRLYALRAQMQAAADAAALAGASALIDGDSAGDSVQARAQQYVATNPLYTTPASLESLYVNTDEGTVRVVLRYQTGPMLWAPAGLILRMAAGAQVSGAQPGEAGRPIPNGNAFGWWKQEKVNPGAADSAVVRLAI